MEMEGVVLGCGRDASAVLWCDGRWVIKSTIDHERSWMQCFSRVQFGKRMVVGYFRGTLMYADLYGNRDLDRKYGEGMMSVSVK